MEYTGGQVDKYIMENSNKIKEMVMAIKGGQMAMNTTDRTMMARCGVRESKKRMTNYSE